MTYTLDNGTHTEVRIMFNTTSDAEDKLFPIDNYIDLLYQLKWKRPLRNVSIKSNNQTFANRASILIGGHNN